MRKCVREAYAFFSLGREAVELSSCVYLLGYSPLTAFAQSQNLSAVKTISTNTDLTDLGRVINAQTEIRRVDSIEANVDRWYGVITKILKNTAYIKFVAPDKGAARVVFDNKTEFGYCVGESTNSAPRECFEFKIVDVSRQEPLKQRSEVRCRQIALRGG